MRPIKILLAFFLAAAFLLFCGKEEDTPTSPDTVNQAPQAPVLTWPLADAADQPTTVSFAWTCSDPENDTLVYDVFMDTVTPPVAKVFSRTRLTLEDVQNLQYGTTYYWQVSASDNIGCAKSEVRRFATTTLNAFLPLSSEVDSCLPSGAAVSYDTSNLHILVDGFDRFPIEQGFRLCVYQKYTYSNPALADYIDNPSFFIRIDKMVNADSAASAFNYQKSGSAYTLAKSFSGAWGEAVIMQGSFNYALFMHKGAYYVLSDPIAYIGSDPPGVPDSVIIGKLSQFCVAIGNKLP